VAAIEATLGWAAEAEVAAVPDAEAEAGVEAAPDSGAAAETEVAPGLGADPEADASRDRAAEAEAEAELDSGAEVAAEADRDLRADAPAAVSSASEAEGEEEGALADELPCHPCCRRRVSLVLNDTSIAGPAGCPSDAGTVTSSPTENAIGAGQYPSDVYGRPATRTIAVIIRNRRHTSHVSGPSPPPPADSMFIHGRLCSAWRTSGAHEADWVTRCAAVTRSVTTDSAAATCCP